MFENVKFIFVDKNLNDEQIDRVYNADDSFVTKKLILGRLADMCARTTKIFHSDAYGYDSDNDELWRRPLYFVDGVKLSRTAASYNELKSYFEEAIDDGRDDQITKKLQIIITTSKEEGADKAQRLLHFTGSFFRGMIDGLTEKRRI